MIGQAGSYLPLPRFGTPAGAMEYEAGKGYWGRSSDDLVREQGGVPKIMEELRSVIIGGECSGTEGIFRRSSNVSLAFSS